MSSQSSSSQVNEPQRGFNYRITEYFLKNARLTILAFVSLIIFGVVSVLLLKTTGFPTPQLEFAFVQTTYPGASSQTVLNDVTVPLEGAIKNVEGIKRYNSTSANSFSFIQVTFEEKVNIDNTINKLESALSAVSLPSGVNSPLVRKPSVGGLDFLYAISSTSTAQLYNISHQFKEDLTQLESTASVSSPSELKQYAVITVDPQKAGKYGVSLQTIQSTLKTVGESIPAVSGFEVNGKSSSILTTIEGNDLDSIKNLRFPVQSFSPSPTQSSTQPTTVRLDEIATIEIDYRFTKEADLYGFSDGESKKIAQTEFLQINAVSGTDQVAFKQKIEDLLNSYSKNDVVITENESVVDDFDEKKVNVIRVYAVADQNQDQINEVVGGLVGGPLKIDNQVLAQAGWLLGGIQLVFLVMLAFVSWRAALIAAAAIPLSLSFTTIYLYIIGESLNTLVLFSLVLVIGLVVDPALVILEAIQRKIDAGLIGQKAVLVAVQDVGNGIFLAALTNVIVFAPFGVLSGFLGQIFSYIPLTIVPAIIGSYIVPLVFLAWLGGLVLKPNRKARAAISNIQQLDPISAEKELEKLEEKNLWWLSRRLQRLNQTILRSPIWVRLSIIVLTFALSLGIAGYYTASEQVKTATFAVNENTEFVLVTGTHKPEYTSSQKAEIEGKILASILNYSQVRNVYPFSGTDDFTYRIKIDTAKLPKGESTLKLSRTITTNFQKEFNSQVFDIKADIEQTGPPVANYQLSTAIYTNDLDLAKKAALDVRNQMMNLCKTNDNNVILDSACNQSGYEKLVVKVDDGFTGKDNNAVEVLLDRQKIQQAGAVIPGAPLSILVNQTIAQLYEVNRGETITNIQENDELIGVLLETSSTSPKTVEELGNVPIFTTTGQKFLLKDLATIKETTPPQNIQRNRGRTVTVVQGRLNSENEANQSVIQQASQVVSDYYTNNNSVKTTELGLEKNAITNYDDGSSSSTLKTFTELLFALVIAIVLSYIVLVIFFRSFTQPLAIIYTVPLTFIGVYPGLAYFGGGQIGFLEIIGLIILVGVVENVAIFLIDSANQKIDEGMNEKDAIAYAAGVRFRPVALTTLTALVSLLPLAIFSVFYRSIAVVIIGGILVSGVLSLITTPILFIFFKWLSRSFNLLNFWNKFAFVASPLIGIGSIVLFSVIGITNPFTQIISLILILVPIGYILGMGVAQKLALKKK